MKSVRSLKRASAIAGALGIVGFVVAPAAWAQTISIQTTSVAMTTTTGFVPVLATAPACPGGTTLVGGGGRMTLTASPGTDVTNNGAVILGPMPTDAAGVPVTNGSLNPTFWSAYGAYAGMAPGNSSVTAYAMCSSLPPVTSATKVIVTTEAPTIGVGPVIAACGPGESLVGGGGGYTAMSSGVNKKVVDSYPSDNAGVIAANGSTNPTAWTVRGNSNNIAAGPSTVAFAICATDVPVSTQVASVTTAAPTPVAGGATVAATANCPPGTTLLSGGVDTDTGGSQGTHMIGTYPSDGSGNEALTGSASSWTTKSQAGGGAGSSLGTTALALCFVESPPPAVPEFAFPALMAGTGGLLIAGFLLQRQRRLTAVTV